MGAGDRDFAHPAGAELQLDTTAADWFASRVLLWGPGVGTRVCAIVPSGYDAYVRVFHPAKERMGTESIGRTWSELAELSGRQMHPAVQFDRFGWRGSPTIGSLDRPEAIALVTMLTAHTTTPNDCWLALWNGFGRPARSRLDLANAPTVSLPAREYFLYRGPIDVVPRFEHVAGRLQTPNMWWPEDRAWFVATEIDFDSTLVACTRACAGMLLASDLEAREVSAGTRLDMDGDSINPPGTGARI
jgi:hypothetical protein